MRVTDNIIFYIDDEDDRENDKLSEITRSLRQHKITYDVYEVDNKSRYKRDLLSTTVTKMRMNKKIGKFAELAILPIIETKDNAWNGDEIKDTNIEEILKSLGVIEEKKQTKTKLKIKKITRSTRRDIDLSVESLARINVTMIRLINGQDIRNIMSSWTDDEKAAGMIMWRLAQHQNARTMEIFAEMLNDKAKTIDPWKK